jgi:hypothetical protein
VLTVKQFVKATPSLATWSMLGVLTSELIKPPNEIVSPLIESGRKITMFGRLFLSVMD